MLGLGVVLVAGALIVNRQQPPNDDEIARMIDSALADPSADVNTIVVDDGELVSEPPRSLPVSVPARPARPEPTPVPTLRPAAMTASAEAVWDASSDDRTTPASPVPADVAAKFASEPQPQPTTGTAVTIAGCLERDDDTYRLTDTSGDSAPKSRSWKSGFIRKRTASIELVDAANVRLASHVGQRIETTGVIDDREMRVKSLRVQGPCD